MNISNKFWDEVESYNLDSFNNSDEVKRYVNFFKIDKLFESEVFCSGKVYSDIEISEYESEPFKPKYDDLSRLHWLCLKRRAINILEFGSGYSTTVIADACRTLKGEFGEWVRKNIRVQEEFTIYSIEEEQRFLETTLDRLKKARLEEFSRLYRSSVEVSLHDNRFVTLYSNIPNINPDLIYLDGPSQFATTSQIGGFGINSPVRMPMSADILRVEFFLEPGTLIVVDGRTANARFLRAYLKRSWAYKHDEEGDIHYFELQESPLGPFNKTKLNFCLNSKYMLD
jgi:hypothetical protein